MQPIEERTFSFVVRIWWERRDIAGARPAWRGAVDDVQTGTRRYFQSPRALCRYLEARTIPADAPESWIARLRRRFRP
jgi:hypothetical protein